MLATNDFESSFADFTTSPAAENAASLASYESESSKPTALPATSDAFPYPGFGAKYLAVDSGDSTLWRTFAARTADTYFDAYVQFEATSGDVAYSSNAKIVVYLDAESSKLCVISGTSENDHTPVTNTLSQTVTSGTWGRLTVRAIHGSVFSFQILLNGIVLSSETGSASTFYSMTEDATVSTVGFKGTGALDNFVARTTDPHAAAAATVNGERYATLEQAVAEANGATIVLQADHAEAITFSATAGASCRIEKGSYTFGGITSSTLAVVETPDGDVSVYKLCTPAASVNGILYATLTDAMSASTSEYPATLLADCTEAITVPQGTTLYLAEGDYTFSGSFSGAGTVNLRAKPKAYSAATNTSLFSNGWTGTCQLNWNPNGDRVVFNEFGNAGSTVEIMDMSPNFKAFPSTQWTDGTAPTVKPTVKLSGNWFIKDGWAGESTPTVFSILTGSGILLADGASSGTTLLYYNINTISNFTGSLVTGGNNGSGYANVTGRGCFKIGNVVNESATYGTPVVKADKWNTSTFKCHDLDSTTVNGESRPLVVHVDNEDTSSKRGIYLARASVEIDGVRTNFLTVAEAVTSAESARVDSVTVYDGTSDTFEGWVLDNGVYTHAATAYIGETPYAYLADALAAAAALEGPVEVRLARSTTESAAIPSHVTVVAGAYDVTGRISGSGAIRYTSAPAGFKSERFDAGWTGTFVADYDITANASFTLGNYGIEGSRFEVAAGRTLKGYLQNAVSGTTVTNYLTLVVSGTVTLNSGFQDKFNRLVKVTGSGTMNLDVSASYAHGYQIGSLEDWSGTLNIARGTASGGGVENTVENLTSGTGTVTYTVAAPGAAPAIGANWAGNVVIGWSPTGALSAESFGNASSTVSIAGMSSGHLVDSTNSYQVNVASTLGITGAVTLNNGWPIGTSTSGNALWNHERMNDVARLSGSANLTLATPADKGFSNNRIFYHVGVLDGAFGGTITIGYNFGMRVDAVDCEASPAADACVAAITLTGENATGVNLKGVLFGPDGAALTAANPIPLTVGGEASDTKLVYATKNALSGLYAAVAQVGGKYYATLADAVANAGSARSITKLANTSEAVPAGWKLNGDGTAYVKVRGPIIRIF